MAILDVGAKFKFDSAIFTTTFPQCCDCSKCNSACCEYGAIISLKERDVILQLKDDLMPLLLPKHRDSSKWFSRPDPEDFTRVGEAATDEVLNAYVGTGDGSGSCSFFNPEFGCVIQKLAVMHGKHKWAYKPRACILYPLYEDDKNVIKPDVNLDDAMWCSDKGNHARTMFQSCEEEIAYVAGGDALAKLKAMEKDYSPQETTGRTEKITAGKVRLPVLP